MENGNIRSYRKNKGYESIPRDLLQNNELSLEAIGLLCHLQSYPESWKLYKTELYTRFKHNKRTAVQRIWKELVNNNYLIEFKKREGKRYVYQYIYSVEPFTGSDIEKIKQELQNDGFFWTVDFEQSKMDSSKSTTNKLTIKEIDYKRDIEKEERSLRSLSFSTDDDDKLNKKTSSKYTEELSDQNTKDIEPKVLLAAYLKDKEHLKPLAMSLLIAGLSETDCLEIIEFLALLPVIDQQVSDIVNAQIRANEKEALSNGLTDYKAYFLKGLEMKLANAGLRVREADITDPDTIESIPQVTLHNWLDPEKQ
ncbi:hypothetical protein [Enterococcus wangshanyuanii]|uniref:DnaD domain-containing protein n=1 Tax=Enterococcus wangshanyuanii TaxID=2005703 RepID=A0ABQ1PT80_9ENTE|nr:hypothetical protein [Enterococcus wangshanyuanii]GGD03132.1 hypothetical protein GCM10011573_35780 [Enterococcus wangshanyuanii]